MTEADQTPPGVDPTVPNAARLRSYLGGTDDFEVEPDRRRTDVDHYA